MSENRDPNRPIPWPSSSRLGPKEFFIHFCYITYKYLWICWLPFIILTTSAVIFDSYMERGKVTSIFASNTIQEKRSHLADSSPELSLARATRELAGNETKRRVFYITGIVVFIFVGIACCAYLISHIRRSIRSVFDGTELDANERLMRTYIRLSLVIHGSLIAVAISLILFGDLILENKNLHYFHYDFMMDILSRVQAPPELACPSEALYFCEHTTSMMEYMVLGSYGLGVVFAVLITFALVTVMLAPASAPRDEAYWADRAQRLTRITISGSVLLVAGVLIMGLRMKWPVVFLDGSGGGSSGGTLATEFVAVVVGYWGAVFSVMLITCSGLVLYRLVQQGATLQVGRDLLSFASALTPFVVGPIMQFVAS